MNEEADKVVEPVEFEESTVTVNAIKRISLNEEECETNRIATLHKEVKYIDYSSGKPELLIMDVDITPLPISDKKSIMKRCTSKDRAGTPELDFDKMEDLIMAKMLGLSESGWVKFKQTHPIGLYTKLSMLVRDINGETTFTDDEADELKN